MTDPTDPAPGPAADGSPGLPADPTAPLPAGGAPPSRGEPAAPHHRSRALIAACAVLALAVVGLGIWAFSLQSDLNDQKDQTAAAQQQADKASNEADKLSAQLDQLTQDVNNAIDQAGQAGAAAKENLQGALTDLKDRLGALGDQVKPPAQGSGTPTATATAAAATATATPTAGG